MRAIIKEESERASELKAQIQLLQNELKSIERCEDVFAEAKEIMKTGSTEDTGYVSSRTGLPISRTLCAKSYHEVMLHISWICRAAVFDECEIVKNKSGVNTHRLPHVADMTYAQRNVAKSLANTIANAFVAAVQERAWEGIGDETGKN